MKYDLMGRTLKEYVPVINQMAEIQEMQDIIVPDSMPDIARILGCTAEGTIRDKEVTPKGVRVTGVIRADALFTDETGTSVYNLPVVLPFSYLFEKEGADPKNVVFANVSVINGEAREVNPRKLSVRSSAALTCRAFECEEKDIVEEIPSGGSVECLNKPIAVRPPTAAGVKQFSINETVEVPASMCGVESIITYACSVDDVEYKLIQNKAVVKGVANVDLLYNPVGGGAPAEASFELPFSQIVDLEGVDENCRLAPNVSILGCSITPQASDGSQGRELDIGLYLEMQLIACCSTEINPVVDAYSCDNDLTVSKDSLALTDMVIAKIDPVHVRETIEATQPIKNVVYAGVNLSPAAADLADGEDILDSSANVLIIYTGDDSQLYSITRRFKVNLPKSEDYAPGDLSLKAKNVDYSTNLSGNLDIRFLVDVSMLKFNKSATEVLDAIEVSAMAPVEGRARPSVILRYPAEGEKFWDIAKSYRTTRTAIFAANGLEPAETAPQGKLLLIPRK